MKTTATSNGAVIARFIASAGTRSFPPEVVDAAKKCLVDWFGVALGAHQEPAAQAVRRLAQKWAAPGQGRLLLGGTAAPALAALVNGTAAHCLDYDDTHAASLAHMSGPTWAAILALAGEAGLDGAQALAAFIAGFEVGGKVGGGGLGMAITELGFHSTGVVGKLAATAGACAALGLSEERIPHAIGLAATQAGGLTASFGTMAKPFHAGKAAMDAILSAQLSAEQFEAATDLLDSDKGLAGTMVQDGSVRIGPLEFGEGRELLQNAFKPYACCMLTHSSVDAARQLAGQLNGAEVKRAALTVDPLAVKRAGIANPQTPLEGKFSLAFCVALGLNGHPAVAGDFSQARLQDPALRATAERVQINAVPAQAPDENLKAVLEIELSDGRRLQAEVRHPLGNPENPMGWSELADKFMALVEPELGGKSETLLNTLREFEQPGNIDRALELVAGG
ncbi:MAG: MmgE/PrpD family protein [bacterium]